MNHEDSERFGCACLLWFIWRYIDGEGCGCALFIIGALVVGAGVVEFVGCMWRG